MRMFLAGVETVDRQGQQIRRAAFDRTGVTEYGAAEIRAGQFVCVAQGINAAPANTVDLGQTVGALLGSLPAARRNAIASRLGITRAEFEALTIGELLLLFMAGSWQPHRDGKVRIGLAGVTLLERDSIRGGAITDSFTYSNGRLSTVSSGVWTDSSASMAVSSNAILWSAGNSNGDAFHTTELASADHYVQFTAQVGTGDYRGYGAIVRGNGNAAAGSATGYRAEFGCWNDGGVDHQVAITRLDGGSTTEVASANVGAEDTDVHAVLVTAEGTTIEITVDSVLESSYGSASSYTTQKFVGIYAGLFGGSAGQVLDAFEADVLGGTDGTASPGAISVAVALPAAGAKAGAVPTPAALAVALAIPAATRQGGATASPAATSVAAALPAVTTAAGATASPAATNVAVALPAPTVAAGATPTPAATAIAITLPQATAGGHATTTPDAIPVTIAVPQATPAAGSTVNPDALNVPVTIPAATAAGSDAGTATPDAITVPFTLPAPTIAAGATVTPGAIVVTVALPQASASGASAGTASPNAIAVTLTIPAVTSTAGATVTPAATTLAVTFPQATPQAGATVAPDPIALEFTLPTVTLAAGAVVTPDVIQIAVAMPAVVVSYGATVTPAAIQVAIELGAVIAFAGAMVIIFSAPTIWKPPGATMWQPPGATTWKPPDATRWTP